MSKTSTKVANRKTVNNPKTATKTSVKLTTKTTYVAVSNNIYFDGTSYRVRVCKSGTKYSKNFPSKRKSVIYRNSILSA